MKKAATLALIGMMAMMSLSCSTQKSAIEDLDSLVEKIEQNHKEYTKEDWKEIFEEYSTINNTLKEHEYTDEELKEIGRLKGRYMGLLTKKAVKTAGGQLKKFLKQFEGNVEGMEEEMESASEEVEDFAKELENEMEGLSKELEKLSKELEGGLKGFLDALGSEAE